MPDLITHVAVAHLLKRPFEIRNPSGDHALVRTVFYLGVMLPDLLSRPWYILFSPVHDWVVAFHTPFGMLLTSGLLALLFERSLRGKVFLWLMLGVLLHFGIDCLQKQVTGNNFWLFPFSWRNFGYGLFWAGEAVAFMPVWIVLVVLMEGSIHLTKRGSNRSTHENRK
jgi:hypothetical protein